MALIFLVSLLLEGVMLFPLCEGGSPPPTVPETFVAIGVYEEITP